MNLRLGRISVRADVLPDIVVMTIVVVVAVIEIAFFMIGNHIPGGHSIVRGDQIDTCARTKWAAVIDTRRSSQAETQLSNLTVIAPPKGADVIPILVVPFRPVVGKSADLIPALTEIPWFGNELDVSKCVVLSQALKEGRFAIKARFRAPNHRREIEAEAIHPHR